MGFGCSMLDMKFCDENMYGLHIIWLDITRLTDCDLFL